MLSERPLFHRQIARQFRRPLLQGPGLAVATLALFCGGFGSVSADEITIGAIVKQFQLAYNGLSVSIASTATAKVRSFDNSIRIHIEFTSTILRSELETLSAHFVNTEYLPFVAKTPIPLCTLTILRLTKVQFEVSDNDHLLIDAHADTSGCAKGNQGITFSIGSRVVENTLRLFLRPQSVDIKKEGLSLPAKAGDLFTQLGPADGSINNRLAGLITDIFENKLNPTIATLIRSYNVDLTGFTFRKSSDYLVVDATIDAESTGAQLTEILNTLLSEPDTPPVAGVAKPVPGTLIERGTPSVAGAAKPVPGTLIERGVLPAWTTILPLFPIAPLASTMRQTPIDSTLPLPPCVKEKPHYESILDSDDTMPVAHPRRPSSPLC